MALPIEAAAVFNTASSAALRGLPPRRSSEPRLPSIYIHTTVSRMERLHGFVTATVPGISSNRTSLPLQTKGDHHSLDAPHSFLALSQDERFVRIFYMRGEFHSCKTLRPCTDIGSDHCTILYNSRRSVSNFLHLQYRVSAIKVFDSQ